MRIHAEIDVWMSSNRLKLNSEKTQFIWLGGRQQLNKVNINSINLLGSTVNFKSSVINLGVTIDGPLTIKDHVLRICRTSFYQLRQLRVIRGRSQSRPVRLSYMHLFQVDYCNSLLAGVSNELINKLQSVLCSAALLVLKKRKFDPITDDLRD